MATGPARIARGDLALVARSAAGDRLQRDLVLRGLVRARPCAAAAAAVGRDCRDGDGRGRNGPPDVGRIEVGLLVGYVVIMVTIVIVVIIVIVVVEVMVGWGEGEWVGRERNGLVPTRGSSVHLHPRVTMMGFELWGLDGGYNRVRLRK